MIEIGGHLFMTFFFNKQVQILDIVFLFALMFTFQVLKYRQGAIKCAEYFKFFYLLILLISLLMFFYTIESMNYQTTEKMWVILPDLLYGLVKDSIVYISLILVALLAIVFNQVVLEIEEDIHSTGFYWFLFRVYSVSVHFCA